MMQRISRGDVGSQQFMLDKPLDVIRETITSILKGSLLHHTTDCEA
jgi:hypothetical protein